MDELTQQLHDVSLSKHKPTKSRLVYVDILNFSGRFFRVGDHWSFRKAEVEINRFVECAKRSGIQLKVFIDAFIESEETIKIWRRRREVEVEKGFRNMPQALNVLMGELFSKAGIEVCYSVDVDKDDTLASFAHHDRAAVLSQDHNFLKYIGARYRIYNTFEFRGKYLHLVPREDMSLHPGVEMLPLKTPKPRVRNRDPGFITLPKNYLRGSPSPLTKMCGNLHLTVRPLRQAYYAHLGLKTGVKEEFPEYQDDQGVVWNVTESVEPDDKLIDLLQEPYAAYMYFFKDLQKPNGVKSRDWGNHKYATYSIIFELCSLSSDVSLFDMLCEYAKK